MSEKAATERDETPGPTPDPEDAPETDLEPEDVLDETSDPEPDAVEEDDPVGGNPGDGETAVLEDDAPPAPSPETVEEALVEEELSRSLDELQAEFQELNDRHLRLAAEFTNYRRRQETEMTQAWGRAQSDLVRRFLDVLDDLQRVSGLDPADEAVSVESIVEGVDLVERKFLRSLEEAGVEVIEPEGEPFDPALMEAMMRVPAESEEDDDRVAQVFQKGYVLKGNLVRPARVSVYKAE